VEIITKLNFRNNVSAIQNYLFHQNKIFDAVGPRPDGFQWGKDGFVIKVETATPVIIV